MSLSASYSGNKGRVYGKQFRMKSPNMQTNVTLRRGLLDEAFW